jgi:hypothetical protein
LGQINASGRTEGRVESMRTRMELLFEGERKKTRLAVTYDNGQEKRIKGGTHAC